MNEAGLPVAAWLGPRSAPSFVLAAQCSAVQHGHLAATAVAVLVQGGCLLWPVCQVLQGSPKRCQSGSRCKGSGCAPVSGQAGVLLPIWHPGLPLCEPSSLLAGFARSCLALGLAVMVPVPAAVLWCCESLPLKASWKLCWYSDELHVAVGGDVPAQLSCRWVWLADGTAQPAPCTPWRSCCAPGPGLAQWDSDFPCALWCWPLGCGLRGFFLKYLLFAFSQISVRGWPKPARETALLLNWQEGSLLSLWKVFFGVGMCVVGLSSN